jgi:hypothetical protein
MSRCILGLLLPAAIGDQTAAAQGATAYQKFCGDCHTAPAAISRSIAGRTEDEKKAYLRALLTRHHTPDSAEIDQIIVYLITEPRR